MAAESIIQGVTEYFLACPLLKDGVFRVDALGADAVEYCIETDIADPVVLSYVDGSSLRQFVFSFCSREYYSMDRIGNMENSSFYEQLAEWIEENDKLGILPELPGGMEADSLEIRTPGYIFDASMKNARYQISLRLLYFKEAV